MLCYSMKIIMKNEENLSLSIWLALCQILYSIYYGKLSYNLQNINKIDFLNLVSKQLNWFFATISSFSLQPDAVNLLYFKIRLFDLTEFIAWNKRFKTADRKDELKNYRACGKTNFLW